MSTEKLEAAVKGIDPSRTVLLLGAGASFSSGAPLASSLSRALEKQLAFGEHISEDLAEVASILERRNDRLKVINVVIDALKNLKPDGGLLSIASYSWRAIYTTNYDRLIEDAFSQKKARLSVIRSNIDWENAHVVGSVPFYKVHGCITQDRSLGHKASMILTEDDYVDYKKYRDLIFGRFGHDLAGSTTWIVGYSLKDPHIKALADDALRLQREHDAPGNINILVYEYDDDRAALYVSRGIKTVVQGDLNSFAAALHAANTGSAPAAEVADLSALPSDLEPCTLNINTQTLPANPRKMFFGSTASYGDIRENFTFERDQESSLIADKSQILILLGVSGTGKSTVARRVMVSRAQMGEQCFEHRAEFPLSPDAWIRHEQSLRTAGKRGTLLIDNCPSFQRQANQLAKRLPQDSHLRLIVTAETSAWRPRQKDAKFFTDATELTLNSLSSREITSLQQLLTHNEALRSLVPPAFSKLARSQQIEHLRRRCSSDMFVCLKALTESAGLDDIILREYAAIDLQNQDVYRLTAALESSGALPHRQMVLRLSGLSATLISASLEVLEGLVDESEHRESGDKSGGIYLWRTRHEVIADIISKYKYADPVERAILYKDVIETANPTFFVEQRSIRELCTNDKGIAGLPDPDERVALYRLVSTIMPADRVSRHRLIRELISAQNLGDAEAELKIAIKELGLDPPFQRYKVKLLIERSKQALQPVDRKALIRQASDECERGVERFKDSKYMYFITADVAEEWYEVTGEKGMLEWAAQIVRGGYDELHDPDIIKRFDRLRSI